MPAGRKSPGRGPVGRLACPSAAITVRGAGRLTKAGDPMADVSTDLVVGIDENESSLMAVRWAARMARERRLGLRLVHAVDEIPVTYPHASPSYEDAQRFVGERGERVLSRAQA